MWKKLIPVMCLFAASAYAQTRNLDAYKTVYERELEKIKTAFEERSTNWPLDYVKNLTALRTRMQQSGDLDGYFFVNKEMKRFEGSKTLAEQDLVTSMTALQTIQTHYLKITSSLEKDMHDDVLDLKNLYFSHLRKLQVEFTKADKIEEALGVRDEINRVQNSPEITEAELAKVEREIAAEPPVAIVRAPAASAESSDAEKNEQLEEWLGIRKAYMDIRKTHFAGSKSSELKSDYKKVRKKWEKVRRACYRELAEIKPTDPVALQEVKKDYAKAYEKIVELRGEFKKKKGDHKFKEVYKKANQRLDTQQARLDEALGLDQPGDK